MDAQFTIHRSGGVAVTGDSIVGVGPEAQSFDAAQTIDCGARVVMPGLVNAHTHVPMSLLRGLADDLRLDVWIRSQYCFSNQFPDASTIAKWNS